MVTISRTRAVALAVGLGCFVAAPPVVADVVPMPETVSAGQGLLMGVWQEEGFAGSYGRGHHQVMRTLAFGNDDLTMVIFGGVPPSDIYDTAAVRGRWSATQKDEKTWVVTLEQGEGKSDTLTIVFESPDSFTLQSTVSQGRQSNLAPARFHRVTRAITVFTED